MEHTLSNGSRVDCFLFLGSSDLSIAIDSKFSWENYKKMLMKKMNNQKKIHAKNFTKILMNI